MARNKYPEETVKLILDVATHLFVEKGYAPENKLDLDCKLLYSVDSATINWKLFRS